MSVASIFHLFLSVVSVFTATETGLVPERACQDKDQVNYPADAEKAQADGRNAQHTGPSPRVISDLSPVLRLIIADK